MIVREEPVVVIDELCGTALGEVFLEGPFDGGFVFGSLVPFESLFDEAISAKDGLMDGGLELGEAEMVPVLVNVPVS